MSSLIEKTKSSVLFVFPAQIISRILGFAYVIILVRHLSVNDYGAYNFLVGTLLVFSFFTNFGIASSLSRFLPEYAKLGQERRIIKTMNFAHIFRFCMSIVVLGAAFLFFYEWSSHFGQESKEHEFIFFAIGAFFLYQVEFYQIEFFSLFKHKLTSIVQVISVLIKVGVVYIVLSSGFGLVGVFVGEGISFIIAALAFLYMHISYIVKTTNAAVSKEDAIEGRRLTRFSLINAATIPGGILYSHSMDYFVIAAMASAHDLGIYALASRAGKMILSIMPHNLLQGVIRPAFYHQYYSVEEKDIELQRMFSTLVVVIAAFLLPALTLIAVTAEPLIVYVFGEQYIDSVPVFWIFLFFSAITVIELPSDLVIQAIEKVEIRLYAQIFAVYNVIAAIFLMSVYGMVGVAFATGTALVFKCIFMFVMVRQYKKIHIEWSALFKIIINSLVAGYVSYIVLASGDSVLWFLFALIAGIVTYVVATIINNFMTIREKKLVNLIVKRKVFNVSA